MKTLYRICWEINGVKGHGNALLTKSEARDWLVYCRAWASYQCDLGRLPAMNHWMETVEVE